MMSEVFRPCHFLVNPGPFHKFCRYDVCACVDGEECLCSALSSYATMCAARGVMLEWRSAALCGTALRDTTTHDALWSTHGHTSCTYSYCTTTFKQTHIYSSFVFMLNPFFYKSFYKSLIHFIANSLLAAKSMFCDLSIYIFFYRCFLKNIASYGG